MPLKPRVFISYSRKDGEEFAKELRERLEIEKIPLWQDRVDMEGGRDWWLQIVEALDKVEFMVLVMTPEALKSPIIRREWRYARQKGVCIYPVKGVPDSELDYENLPRWMSSAHFYDLENEWAKFVNDLNTRCEIPRVPFMVEDLPEDFIPRPGEFDRLINQLLDANRGEPVAIIAALRGAGGYGKTSLAQAICYDEHIQDAFDDGILWVTLGQTPGDLTAKLNDIIEILDGKRPGFTEIQPAMAKLAELLSDRDILFIIDDVWNRAHLNPFLQGGGRCARLITTRNRDALPPKCEHIDLEAMKQQEAQQLLGFDLVVENTQKIGELSHRLGEWPLLLKLVNGVLRNRVKNMGQSLPDAIAFVNKALDRRGLTVFDSRSPENRSQAVSSTFSISLDSLSDEERARYGELAIFPEGVNIPLETVEKLWQHAGFDDLDTETLCERFLNLSLILNLDLNTRQISLHDVVREYLRTKHLSDLKNINAQFLSAYGLQNWADLPANEPYLWKYLAYHLFESERADALKALLLDFSWLKNKLDACDVNALISDYDYFLYEEDLKLLQGALRLSSNQLTLDQNQLTGHLVGRLMSQKSTGLKALLKKAVNEKTGPWLRPLFPSLTPPGGPLLRTLEGHSNSVNAVAISPDGKTAVSGSTDHTLKLWDLSTGGVIYTLEGHSNSVDAVAISPDGKTVVSGSHDETLRVWDLGTGQLLRTLEAHSNSVNAVAISPDGKTALSGSKDQTLILWDLRTGEVLKILEGHSNMIRAVAISPDGKTALSGSNDQTLKLWDLGTGQLLKTFEGHGDMIVSVAINPNGKTAVFCSSDQTLKLLDLGTGQLLKTFEGHSDWNYTVAISPDGKTALSGSNDQTLKLWDLSTGQLLKTFEGHGGPVYTVAISPDGRTAVSGSHDETLRLWDLGAGKLFKTFKDHGDWIWTVAISPDGKTALSGSKENTIKLWDLSTGQLLKTFEGHGGWITSVAISPDGKTALSGSNDQTLKLWDLETGHLLKILKGHIHEIWTVAISPDGKTALSGSWDKTLKLWDLSTGQLLRTLEGHGDSIEAVAISPNGKTALSGSDDNTIKLWDLSTGKVLKTFKGHSGWIRAVAISPDGKTAVSGSFDKTVKLWDLGTEKMLTSFTGETENFCVSIAPCGKIVLAGGQNGCLHFLRIEID